MSSFLKICLSVICIHTCLVPEEARESCQTLWSWNYRQLWAATWVLGIRPASPVGAASAPKPLSSPLSHEFRHTCRLLSFSLLKT